MDDGKSTLIGRLLFEAGAVPRDQMAALERDSRRFGTRGAETDFALLLDGLQAEREQGITIDVAYRHFATPRRAFIVADAPGHEQYTRNMATGASTADAAVILLDAARGILPQTRRHACIAAMMGVPHVVLAVNKMDLVGFGAETFAALAAGFRAAVAPLGFASIACVPICARDGDNLAARSARMPWHDGPTLLEVLETLPAAGIDDDGDAAFRMQVQWVNRPDPSFRGFAGTIAAGRCQPGDEVTLWPGGRRTRIARLIGVDGDAPRAGRGDAVTLAFEDEIDLSRGGLVAGEGDGAAGRVLLRPRLRARLLWMHETPGRAGAPYLLQLGGARAGARIAALHHELDIQTLDPVPCDELGANRIGEATLALQPALPAMTYAANRALGGFILIDPVSRDTVALGMVLAGEDEPVAARADPDPVPAPVAPDGRETVSRRAAAALGLFGAAWLLTGRVLPALALAALDLGLRRPLRRLHGRAWRRWRRPRDGSA